MVALRFNVTVLVILRSYPGTTSLEMESTNMFHLEFSANMLILWRWLTHFIFFASFDIFGGHPHSVAYICLTSAVHLIYFAISSVLWKIFNFRQTIRSEAPRCHANGYGCVYEAFGEIVFWISCKILCWNFHFDFSCLINRTRPPMVDYWAGAAIRCREQNRQACLFVIMRSFKHGVFRTDAC